MLSSPIPMCFGLTQPPQNQSHSLAFAPIGFAPVFPLTHLSIFSRVPQNPMANYTSLNTCHAYQITLVSCHWCLSPHLPSLSIISKPPKPLLPASPPSQQLRHPSHGPFQVSRLETPPGTVHCLVGFGRRASVRFR